MKKEIGEAARQAAPWRDLAVAALWLLVPAAVAYALPGSIRALPSLYRPAEVLHFTWHVVAIFAVLSFWFFFALPKCRDALNRWRGGNSEIGEAVFELAAAIGFFLELLAVSLAWLIGAFAAAATAVGAVKYGGGFVAPVRRTSFRFDIATWEALADVAQRERISVNKLCSQIEAAKPDALNLTVAIRSWLLNYFRH
jgi:hypothetical protein